MHNPKENLSEIIKNKKIVLVLSRKGMDTATGKMASPIFYKTKKMLSLPIPILNKKEEEKEKTRIEKTNITYSEKYNKIIEKLNKNNDNQLLHCDPMIDPSMIEFNDKIRPSLGQCGPAATYLLNGFEKNGITKNGIILENTTIIFLFFGRFHFVKDDKYIKNYKDDKVPYYDKDLHVIWGYLVVDNIVPLKENNSKEYNWHPHSTDYYISNSKSTKNNTLFISEAGNAGVFKFDENLILTNTKREGKNKDIASAIWRKNIFPEGKEGDKLPFKYIGERKNSATATSNELFLKGQWQEIILTDSNECKTILYNLGITKNKE